MKVREYFKDSEICCPCCGLMPDYRAVTKLYALRILTEMPITVNSGIRCSNYNKKVNGSKNSRHVKGVAFDISVRNHNKNEYLLIENAIKCGFTGIGIRNNTFLHIDTRYPKAVWVYTKETK